jgi:hypothetical protein
MDVALQVCCHKCDLDELYTEEQEDKLKWKNQKTIFCPTKKCRQLIPYIGHLTPMQCGAGYIEVDDQGHAAHGKHAVA